MAFRRPSCVILAASLQVVACGDENRTPSPPADPVAAAGLFGDDRVGDLLGQHLDRAPASLAQFEELFGVGRRCRREESHEVFIIEEASSRRGGVQKPSPVQPRAVFTGCSTDAADPKRDQVTASLFVAVISSPDAPHAATGDSMITDDVEVMATDRTSGLYNFYVFRPSSGGAPGVVQRIVQHPDGTVEERTQGLGQALDTRPAQGRRCLSCHGSFDPLMNELSDPWTHWVSVRTPKAQSTGLTGDTLSIVEEARASDGAHTRVSFASALEVTVRVGLHDLVAGLPERPGSGLGWWVLRGGVAGAGGAPVPATPTASTMDGTVAPPAPNGDEVVDARRALRSVFCDTALNFTSPVESAPLELFVDPAVILTEGIARPVIPIAPAALFQMPIRSELDLQMEQFLVARGFLTAPLALAARVVDDRRDALSTTRCALWSQLSPGPKARGPWVEDVRRVLAAAAAATPAGPKRDYLQALVDPTASPASLEAPRKAYADDVRRWVRDDARLLETDTGRQVLVDRVKSLKAAAAVLFPTDANPLPVFP